MINVVIPMAGLGSRFAVAGYSKPKPFIDVDGLPMVERVIQNLSLPNARYILIGRREHISQNVEIVEHLKKSYNASLVIAEELTQGTACTVLLAESEIYSEDPVLIANSDQIVDINIFDFVNDCKERNLDGSIMTFIDAKRDPKWSFAKIGENGLVTEVKEKKPISDLATVGIYLFMNGMEFVHAARRMIDENDRVNNEFYTCPIYNYLIMEGAKIGTFNISVNQMHGLGIPSDLEAYIALRSGAS